MLQWIRADIEKFFLCICLSVIWTGCAAGDTNGESSSEDNGDDERKLLWGYAVAGQPQDADEILDVEKRGGIEAGLAVFFASWPAPDRQAMADFPKNTCQSIRKAGAVPVLTWEPFYFDSEGEERMIDSETIRSGEYDAYIDDFARRVKAWGEPLIIRFGHEMNLRRYHWGTAEKEEYGPESPEKYKKMYRYVVGRFRQEDVRNVFWAFCPNAESVPNTSFDKTASWNTIPAYYPGDAWVDVLGMDGYNWGASRTEEEHGWTSHWQSFADIFEDARQELRKLAPEKPLVVFETSSVAQGGDRSKWLQDAVTTAAAWDLDGICWFQENKENDWRLSISAYSEVVESIRSYTGADPTLLWQQVQGGAKTNE